MAGEGGAQAANVIDAPANVVDTGQQGYALSLAGLRRQVDPHWKRGMSFLRIGLAALQMAVADVTAGFKDWLPTPLQALEPCIPSRQTRRRQAQD